MCTVCVHVFWLTLNRFPFGFSLYCCSEQNLSTFQSPPYMYTRHGLGSHRVWDQARSCCVWRAWSWLTSHLCFSFSHSFASTSSNFEYQSSVPFSLGQRTHCLSMPSNHKRKILFIISSSFMDMATFCCKQHKVSDLVCLFTFVSPVVGFMILAMQLNKLWQCKMDH